MINNNQEQSRGQEVVQNQRFSDSQTNQDNSTLQTSNQLQNSNRNPLAQDITHRNTFAQLDQIYQPLLQSNTLLKNLNDNQKQKFLTQINGLWMFQEAIQIIFSVITILDFNYDKFFYNFDKQRYRAPLYFFFIISVSQLLLILFYKPARSKQNAFFIFLIFTITYSLWISGLISGQHSDIWNIERAVQIGFAIFIGTICNFLTLITIQFHFSLTKEPIQFMRTIKYLFIPPFIYAFIFNIFNPFDFEAVLILWMATELWALIFGGLYLYSVLQIIHGKFELHQDQTISAALLTFINMFFPFGNF